MLLADAPGLHLRSAFIEGLQLRSLLLMPTLCVTVLTCALCTLTADAGLHALPHDREAQVTSTPCTLTLFQAMALMLCSDQYCALVLWPHEQSLHAYTEVI